MAYQPYDTVKLLLGFYEIFKSHKIIILKDTESQISASTRKSVEYKVKDAAGKIPSEVDHKSFYALLSTPEQAQIPKLAKLKLLPLIETVITDFLDLMKCFPSRFGYRAAVTKFITLGALKFCKYISSKSFSKEASIYTRLLTIDIESNSYVFSPTEINLLLDLIEFINKHILNPDFIPFILKDLLRYVTPFIGLLKKINSIFGESDEELDKFLDTISNLGQNGLPSGFLESIKESTQYLVITKANEILHSIPAQLISRCSEEQHQRIKKITDTYDQYELANPFAQDVTAGRTAKPDAALLLEESSRQLLGIEVRIKPISTASSEKTDAVASLPPKTPLETETVAELEHQISLLDSFISDPDNINPVTLHGISLEIDSLTMLKAKLEQHKQQMEEIRAKQLSSKIQQTEALNRLKETLNTLLYLVRQNLSNTKQNPENIIFLTALKDAIVDSLNINPETKAEEIFDKIIVINRYLKQGRPFASGAPPQSGSFFAKIVSTKRNPFTIIDISTTDLIEIFDISSEHTFWSTAEKTEYRLSEGIAKLEADSDDTNACIQDIITRRIPEYYSILKQKVASIKQQITATPVTTEKRTEAEEEVPFSPWYWYYAPQILLNAIIAICAAALNIIIRGLCYLANAIVIDTCHGIYNLYTRFQASAPRTEPKPDALIEDQTSAPNIYTSAEDRLTSLAFTSKLLN